MSGSRLSPWNFTPSETIARLTHIRKLLRLPAGLNHMLLSRLLKTALATGVAVAAAGLLSALENHGSAMGRESRDKAPAAPDRERRQGARQTFFTRWKEILGKVVEQVGSDRVLAVAGGVTFYGLLALFPTITAFVSIYGLFADRATVFNHLAVMQSFLPDGAISIISEQLRRILATPNASLGIAFVLGFGIALWSANAGMKAMMEALNIAYGETEKRSFIRLNAQSLAFTLIGIVFLLIMLSGIAVVPVILDFFRLGEVSEWLLWAGRWPAIFAILLLGLSLLYRFGPSCTNAKWQWITPGAAVAAVGLLGFSMVFSWYAANFGSYNETYGSLGAAIGLMTWMWLSATIVLIGAELNSEIATHERVAADGTISKLTNELV